MWAVELGSFPEADDRLLLAALRKQSIPFLTFRGHEFRQHEDLLRNMHVPRGSCWFVATASNLERFRADWWGLPGNFDCSAYYTRYGQVLLNYRHHLLRLSELCWNADAVIAEWGDADGNIFVRPNSGFQPFKGKVVHRAAIGDWCEARAKTYVPSDTLVVVACPQAITQEWRAVVVDGRVVAAGDYGKSYQAELPYEGVAAIEDAIGAADNPFRACVVDVVATSVGWQIVEVGSMLCCSWYEANYDAIVTAIQQLMQT